MTSAKLSLFIELGRFFKLYRLEIVIGGFRRQCQILVFLSLQISSEHILSSQFYLIFLEGLPSSWVWNTPKPPGKWRKRYSLLVPKKWTTVHGGKSEEFLGGEENATSTLGWMDTLDGSYYFNFTRNISFTNKFRAQKNMQWLVLCIITKWKSLHLFGFTFRQKYQTVESEASKTSEVLRDGLGMIKGKVQETLDEVGKTDIAKKAGQKKRVNKHYYTIIFMF